MTVLWMVLIVATGTIYDRNLSESSSNRLAPTESPEARAVSRRSASNDIQVVPVAPPPEIPEIAESHPLLPAKTEKSQVEALIFEVWPGNDEAVLRVIRCESKMNPLAVGRAKERGLLQIHPIHRKWLGSRWELLFDPVENLKAGWELYQRSGAMAWTCARSLGITSFG